MVIMEDLFLRVGLQVNGKKMKAMAILPTVATTTISNAAYKHRMTGEGETYCEHKQAQISCPLCKTAMQACSLTIHFCTKHPTIPIPRPTDTGTHMDSLPTSYIVYEPDKKAAITCPVPNCTSVIKGSWYAIRRHFFFRHKTVTVMVVDKGELPSCSECGFQCARPHDRHQRSDMCQQGRLC